MASLNSLTKSLERVEENIFQLNKESVWKDYLPSKEQFRGYTNIKNILGTLVRKTIDGKTHDDDIALICSECTHQDESPIFQNIISSEEYLSETKKILNSTQAPEVILQHLLTSQELLGDIIYSVCQINNYQLKLPSGVLVKDLIKVKSLYSSIWDSLLLESISSKQSVKNSYKTSKSSVKSETPSGFQTEIAKLHRSLQLCFKEMSKVKLEIEHYFTLNFIEMQTVESDNPLTGSGIGRDTNSVSITHSTEDDSNFNIKELNTQSTTNSSVEDCESIDISSEETMLMSKKTHAEGYDSMYLFPPKHDNSTTWLDDEAPTGDFCSQPLDKLYAYPPQVFFFDPTTMSIQSKIDPQKNSSLPRIYSVHSVNEEVTDPEAPWNKQNTFCQKDILNDSKNMNFPIKSDSNITENNSTVEDLFHADKNFSSSESQMIDLKTKVSSLFNMLKSNKIYDNDNIFDATSLKIENSDMSYPEYQYENKEFKMNKENPYTNATYFDTIKMRQGYKQKQVKTNLHIQNDANINLTSQGQGRWNEDYRFPCMYNVDREYPVNVHQSCQDDVIYDKRSLIEIFKTTEGNRGSNSSGPQEESSFCLWPVAAEYIYVSKVRNPNGCHSDSSDNSISLSKSFEKSFFSLHLNKRYQQNHQYEGDLIVLENSNEFKNEENLNYSMLDHSDVFLNADQDKVGHRETKNISNKDDRHTKQNLTDMLPLRKEVISKLKKGRQKTVAVQYANCGDSFMIKKQNFNKEDFDFLKIDGFHNKNNWNSFISIFTSKVGPSRRINHHRMFRRLMNNFGTDPLPSNNLFGNVHTLTSNGGPFRLFDLNGYPLTDSAGNVLVDPYGKSVVHLDSTGFPKDDVTVYDAAGNSPKDINFDPTQKPKTNTIIIKLTDNFKRPLHLFDKYGRPLTDSNGKLLVNIHGRPLLRFDNFGRPNTDYRGGPLYTDNGFRWSYKIGETLSEEQLGGNRLPAPKLSDIIEIEPMEDSCETVDVHGERKEALESEYDQIHDNKITDLNQRNSDIWIKIESVLQNIQKKKQDDLENCQSNVIINKLTVTQTPIEKELLKSTIYHETIVQQDMDHTLNMNNRPEDKATDERKNQCDCLTKGLCLERSPIRTAHFPFYNNVLLRSPPSRCVVQSQNHQKCPGCLFQNKYLKKKNYNNYSFTSCMEDVSSKAGCFNISTCHSTDAIKEITSNISFKNHEYLDKLCNQFLKYQADTKHKELPVSCVANKTMENWTDSENTRLTSSIDSKYTTELPIRSELPGELPLVNYKECNQEKTLRNNYKTHYDKNIKQTQCSRSKKDFLLQKVKHPQNYYKEKDKLKLKLCKSDLEKRKIKNIKSETKYLSASSGTAVSINVLNEEDRHYEIKVVERVTDELGKNKSDSTTEKSIFSTNSAKETSTTQEYEVLWKRKKNNHKREVDSRLEEANPGPEQRKQGKQDSPFRFPSEEQIKSGNSNMELKYIQNRKYESDSNISSNRGLFVNNNKDTYCDNIRCENEDRSHNQVKYTNYFHKLAPQGCEREDNKKNPEPKGKVLERREDNLNRKPAQPNRECNLVSFFGSPVKYVLNKLENKKSSKQYREYKSNTQIKPAKKHQSKEHIPRITCATNSKNNVRETTYKATCNHCKLSKHKLPLSKEKLVKLDKPIEINKWNKRDNLLAFRSRSCIDLVPQNRPASMSYSGNDKQNHPPKTEPTNKDLPSSSYELHTSFSESSCMSKYFKTNREEKKEQTLHHYQKYKAHESKAKHPVYDASAFNKKHKSPHHKTDKHSRDIKKQSGGRNGKAAVVSTKKKTKDFSLLKKSELRGKHSKFVQAKK